MDRQLEIENNLVSLLSSFIKFGTFQTTLHWTDTMKQHQLEIERHRNALKARLSKKLQNRKQGPLERELLIVGHHLFSSRGRPTFTPYTKKQIVILDTIRLFGLCKLDCGYRHQEALIDWGIEVSEQTGDPRDILLRPMIHVFATPTLNQLMTGFHPRFRKTYRCACDKLKGRAGKGYGPPI